MAAKQTTPTPIFYIHCSRFTEQDGWRLRDLSISAFGKIAVSGGNINTYRTFIEVFSQKKLKPRDKQKLIYLKEFEKYETEHRTHYLRYISFIDLRCECDKILTCLGNKLELIQVSEDKVVRSRRVNGDARCLSVREKEIFIGFSESNKVTIYDAVELYEIKSIVLEGIRDGEFPFEMFITAHEIFVCAGRGGEDRPLLFGRKDGELLSEFTNSSTCLPYARSVTANTRLGVVAFVWSDLKGREWKWQVSLYNVKEKHSFFTFDVENGVSSIRMSHRADAMVTGNRVTGEVKIFDMAELLSYHHFKQNLISQLHMDDCAGLMNYFALYKDRPDATLKSEKSTENLFLALEEIGAVQPSSIDRLIEAFHELNISRPCYHLAQLYKQTIMPSTSYDRFLATLSAHLTADLPKDLCHYFNVPDEKRNIILSSRNPGLSLLLNLNERAVISSSSVDILEQSFIQFKLVQAVAKIHEYQSIVKKEKTQSLLEAEITDEGKREFFVQCLRRKIKSWYETMTPLPWQKSCKWKSTDLFVGCGLILTDSKSKRSLMFIDEKCKVEYKQIFSHDKLLSEKRIILEGEPGSGKTMLMSQLAYDWSQGKLGEIKTLILLPLKLVQQRTLVEAIKDFYVPEDKSLSISEIENFLQEEKKPTHLLLDGLEEYSGSLELEKSEVMEVMLKVKYPSCKVLISSRSDFAKHLPKCPMLKLGRFGDKERSSYIETLFPEDSKKQMETKQVIDDSPILKDLCSVPLLFVLMVHNVENLGKSQMSQLDRVTPFVRGIVDTLCPLNSLIAKTQDLDLGYLVHKETSLEKLAYNGLCRGCQQLYWQKEFVEEKIQNVKEWIDSGILVLEESNSAIPIDRKSKHPEVADTDSGDSNVIKEEESSWSSVQGETVEEQSNFYVQSDMRVEDSDKGSKADTRSDDNDKQSLTTQVGESNAKKVPLQVKFLHKIIQEWFAARYFSSMITKVNLDLQEKYLFDHLPLINPADLHHVLRFTCALYPPCCHIIMNHLLSNRNNEGNVPEYIMNCVFLCFAEYTGEHNFHIQAVLSEVFKEDIWMHSEDSRLLQQAKVAMLEGASSQKILIRKLILSDLVVSAREDALLFNSGVTMVVLDTLEAMELSRWDHTLKGKDYENVLKFIAKSSMLRRAGLHFPDQPPRMSKETAVALQKGDKTVKWMIGSKLCQVLDPETRKWMLLEEVPPSEIEQQRKIRVPKQVASASDDVNVKIQGTKVELAIPSDALPRDVDKSEVKIRIIPRHLFKDLAPSFSSNSAVVVEIIPNNMALESAAKLTLPHCLSLLKGADHKAKIFMSHHEEGGVPQWQEHIDVDYGIRDEICTLWLKRFCWVAITIDEKTVLGKKLILFTSKGTLHRKHGVEIGVGFYYDGVEERGEFLQRNQNMEVTREMPFMFMKEGTHPLCFQLEKFTSPQWQLWSPEDQKQVISYKHIAASLEFTCVFVFKKKFPDAKCLQCAFKVSQEQGQDPVQLSIYLEKPQLSQSTCGLSPFGNQSQPGKKYHHGVALRRTFRFLSRKLGSEWEAVARELGIPDEELFRIKADNRVIHDAIYRMLMCWKQKKGRQATYANLIKSLKTVGRTDLAEKVRRW